MKSRTTMLVTTAALVALAGCQSTPDADESSNRATASLVATKGSKVFGEVTFEQVGDKVQIVANVTRLTPKKRYGFHIHETGDCSSGDGMSAGGHFNPHGQPHGRGPMRHAGDLPNLAADAKGRARLSMFVDLISVTPGPGSIIGRGLIVHAQPDDYKTQPTGNAGARLACGVIKAS